jgi:hypothetical protein
MGRRTCLVERALVCTLHCHWSYPASTRLITTSWYVILSLKFRSIPLYVFPVGCENLNVIYYNVDANIFVLSRFVEMDLCIGSRSRGGVCGACRERHFMEIGRWRNQLAQDGAKCLRPEVILGSFHCHSHYDECLHLPSQW